MRERTGNAEIGGLGGLAFLRRAAVRWRYIARAIPDRRDISHETLEELVMRAATFIILLAASASTAFAAVPNATGGNQYRSDTSAAIPFGGTIPFGVGVYFEANVSDADGNTIKMEVELRKLPATFTGVANYTSNFVSTGSRARTSTATGLTSGNYGWRYRVVDSTGAASNWVPANNPDFIVGSPPNQTPTANNGNQYRSDTMAAIPFGGTIPFGVGVYFEANVSDADGDTINMEVELRQLPATFTGAANYSSGFVSSGTRARTSTATSLSSGNYGWRYRVVDSRGAASNWVPANNPDFIVGSPPNQTPTANNGNQYRSDTAGAIPFGGTIPFGVGVYFEANVSDPDGDTVNMEVELRQLPATFTGVANYTSGFVSSGTRARTSTATGLSSGNYGWRYRVVDSRGAASNWVPANNPDFIVGSPPNQVPTANNGNQYRSDTTAAIPFGGTIPFGVGVYFEANVSDPDADTVNMEVELRQLPATFTGVANYTSGFVSSGTRARTSTATSLSAGNYGWRYRVVDSRGAASNWVPANNPDFIVGSPPNQSPTANNGNQYRSDTTAAIPFGATIPIGVGVYFEANVNDADGDTIQMEAELRQLPATFTGVANYTSGFVSSGTRARTSTATSPSAGNYGWRYRVVDSRGAAGGWVPENNPDFVVQNPSIEPPVSDGFDYPIGAGIRYTEANDGDGWYDANDFGDFTSGLGYHLGEDWNAETGGNTDCGLPVYAASNGTIVFSAVGGGTWGNVLVVRHVLPDGTPVETLYGHLQSFVRSSGDVSRRELIAAIGNGDGTLACHLHFEVRSSNCPSWGVPGPGYSASAKPAGWTDPSDFIDAHRPSNGEQHLTGIKIGVDPGHGGTDDGATGPTGLTEKSLNLTTALALKKYLEGEGATVIMTRTTDVTLDPTPRYSIFVDNDVDLGISVHHNYASDASVNTTMVFIYCDRALIVNPGTPGSRGLLASKVVQRLGASTGIALSLSPASTADTLCVGHADWLTGITGVGQANLFMVREPETRAGIPSILAEVSFISKPSEETKLRDPDYLDKNGWAIYAGIADYYGFPPLPRNTRELLSCNPWHCNIDARIAHDRLDQDIKKNRNTMVMTFSESTAGMTAADFEVTLVPFITTPPTDIIPGISAVTPDFVDPKITTLTLNRRIQQTRWTCIRDKGSNRRCCMGSLPGDADDNRISQPNDIFDVFDNLNGVVNPPSGLPKDKCDTDRSLLCTPADLLMVVDLLNGADAFDPTEGNTLPVCPSFLLPP